MAYAETILPEEITSSIQSEIEKFGRVLKMRILLFRNLATTTPIDVDPIGDGHYSTSTGVYDLDEWTWVKKIVLSTTATKEFTKVEYEDKNGNWIRAKTVDTTTTSTTVTLKYPIFVKKLRFVQYADDDPSSTWIPTVALVYSDSFFDVTKYIGEEIIIEQNTAGFSDNIKIPFTSITLTNENGRWNKNIDFTLPLYYVKRTSSVYDHVTAVTDNVKDYKLNGTRVTVEIQFKDTDKWIILSNFYIRKWSNVAFEGESGWVAKTKIETPLIEGETVRNIIEKFIIRDKNGECLIQYHQAEEEDELITVVNEDVGDIVLNPEDPQSFGGGLGQESEVLSHCYDGSYFYYALREHVTATNEPGSGMRIFRARPNGTPELLGVIRAEIPQQIKLSAVTLNFSGWWTSGVTTWIYGGASFSRYVQHVFQMAVDETYLYIPICSVIHGSWYNPTPGTMSMMMSESCVYKLPKNGDGWDAFWDGTYWGSMMSPTVVIPEAPADPLNQVSTPYAQSYKISQGFTQITQGGTNPFNIKDPCYSDYDEAEIFTGVDIVKDTNGNTKLLIMKQAKGLDNANSNAMTEYWLFDRDWDPNKTGGETWSDIVKSQQGESGNREHVICTKMISDTVGYVVWEDFTTNDYHFGTFSRDDLGDYFIDTNVPHTTFVAKSDIPFSMAFYADGLYASGKGYDIPLELTPVDNDGIEQYYRSLFYLQGYNIAHFNNPPFDNFLSYPVPLVTIGGADPSAEIVKWAQDGVYDGVYRSIAFSLDLRNGELYIVQAFPTDGTPVRASYDFTLSSMFYKAEDKSRLSKNVLGKLQQASEKTFFINEHGGLEKLPFLETQTIPIKYMAGQKIGFLR
jgi:hypothetical protein